jgi:class 3 adenylate cyclase
MCRTSASGHQGRFRPPTLNGSYRLGKATFAGIGGKEEDAPEADHAPTRGCDDLPLSENNMVGRTDHGGMIGREGRSRRDPQMRRTPRDTLNDPQQIIADLQRKLAERTAERDEALRERDEALQRETATAEVLGVINSSPGDLKPVFDAMLEKALRFCEATHGTLRTFDGESFHLAAAAHGEALAFPDRDRLRPGGPSSLFRRFIDGEQIVHLTDVLNSPEYQSNPTVRQGWDAARLRSWLGVSLRNEERLLGIIAAARQEVRPFTDKQITLLQNFAAQAVIAMENARLITETREALEQQTATAAVLGVINSSPGDLAPVFDAMLDKALHLCLADYGVLWIRDGDVFRAGAIRGASEEFVDFLLRERVPVDADMLVPRAVRDGARFVQIPNLAEIDHPIPRAAAELGGIRTGLFVPLRKEALLGMIVAGRKEVRPFTDKQIALLQNFAAQAVIAMENARLLGELRQRTDEVGELNRGLEARVAEQVDELGRVGRLKRFLAPQLAEMIVSQGDEKILESHRREIVVVFCDLRGYTAFTETAEPEEVLEFLRQYHGALGPLVSQFEGTLDQFSGDGIMVFFNDPVPCPDPAERAVKMAMAMREAARELIVAWSRHGCELGFGAGIAQGFATLGQIGFSERSGYTAIGTVCNLAARLCAEAKDGQILISSRIAEAVEGVARLEDLGNLELKGLRRPVAAFNVVRSTSPAEARPNLTVVARDTGA